MKICRKLDANLATVKPIVNTFLPTAQLLPSFALLTFLSLSRHIPQHTKEAVTYEWQINVFKNRYIFAQKLLNKIHKMQWKCLERQK